MTVINVNKTINITSVGFFSSDQFDNAPLSPNNKLMKYGSVKIEYKDSKEMNYTCKK